MVLNLKTLSKSLIFDLKMMEAINLEWKPFLEDQSNYRLDETSSIKDYFNEEINFNKF